MLESFDSLPVAMVQHLAVLRVIARRGSVLRSEIGVSRNDRVEGEGTILFFKRVLSNWSNSTRISSMCCFLPRSTMEFVASSVAIFTSLSSPRINCRIMFNARCWYVNAEA